MCCMWQVDYHIKSNSLILPTLSASLGKENICPGLDVCKREGGAGRRDPLVDLKHR